MILNKILEESAHKFPNKPAVTMKMGFRIKTLSYKEVFELSKQIAIYLEKQGIKKGDKVLICAPNSPYWVCVFWATLLRGAIIVPLNIQSTKQIIESIAKQTEAKIIFKYLFLKTELPNIKQIDIECILDLVENYHPKNYEQVHVDENDLFQIMYTSGTTGEPKGVMLTHKNVFSNLIEISKIIMVSPSKDRLLSVLPLSHIYEQTMGFLLPFWNGIEIIYAHSYSSVRSLMKKYKITKMVAVPEFLHVLMNRIELELENKKRKNLFEKLQKISLKINKRFISRILFYPILRQLGGKINLIASGGAALDITLANKWRALGIRILQGYGLTETSPVVATNTFSEIKIGSVGKPIDGIQVKLGPDKEILVKGPNVFAGYYKNEEKTKESFTVDGFFKTGDLGEFDKDGFLYIRGRKKYMIKSSGGQNVYPEDIEGELNKFVKDSCVIGIEKDHGAVEIHAILILDNSKKENPEKIIEKVNLNLASYQQIHSWSIWPDSDFPRTVTKKIKKEEVKKLIENKLKETAKIQESKKSKLIQIIAQITGTDIAKINDETKIVKDLHLDSLMRIELVSLIEENFGILINETDIKPNTTVKEVEEIIKLKKPVKELPPLKKWPRSWIIFIPRVILQEIFFILTKIFVKLNVEGLENLKNLKLPAMFMPNHISYLDSVVVPMAIPISIRLKLSFAAARDVLYKSYKYLVIPAELLFNSFPIQRKEGENIKLGLDFIGEMLDSSFSVVIYPEGKMSLDGKLQNLQKGAGLIATEMDVYIVPIKIIGTNEIVPYGNVFPKKRGKVTVKFGKPLKFNRCDSSQIVIEKIHEAMKSL